MQKLTFEVREDKGGSGCLRAGAVGVPVFTQGRDWEHLRAIVREPVKCQFEAVGELPRRITQHFVRNDVPAL